MELRPPLGVMPVERIAIFIDGTNFKYATYDAFGIRVDFAKLLAFFSKNAILLRAYYYTGEWDDSAITQFLRLTEPPDPAAKRLEMERQRDGDRKFWRFLDRNGFRVVRKSVRVFRDGQGDIRVKADLDLELAIDMLTLAERCEKQILVSGDGDFVPLVHAVAARGVRVSVVSTQSEEAYRSAHYRASDDLLDAADEFLSIESIRAEIEREWTGVPNGRQLAGDPSRAQEEALRAPADGWQEAPQESTAAGSAVAARAEESDAATVAVQHGEVDPLKPLVSPAAAAAAARYAAQSSSHGGRRPRPETGGPPAESERRQEPVSRAEAGPRPEMVARPAEDEASEKGPTG
jgi:uncharacterized LabA/DUF88 family protein